MWKHNPAGMFADWRKNDAKALRAASYAAGKIPVLQKHVDAARKFCERVHAYVAVDGSLAATHPTISRK